MTSFLSLFMLVGLFSAPAYSFTDEELRFMEQRKKMKDFFERNFPAAVEDEKYVPYVRIGKTEKGEPCKIVTAAGGVSLIEHPKMSESDSTYSEYNLSWDGPFEQPSASYFFITEDSLKASATRPSGLFGTETMNLAVSKQNDGSYKITLKSRSSKSYLSCIFIK